MCLIFRYIIFLIIWFILPNSIMIKKHNIFYILFDDYFDYMGDFAK